MSDDLTKRQREALAWLRACRRASPKLSRAAGFQDRTFDALVDAGLVERVYSSRSEMQRGRWSFYWRAAEHEAESAVRE